MKKIMSLFLSLTMLLSLTVGLDLTVYADVVTGKCGDNVTYSLDTSTGVLTISGTGNMYNYSNPDAGEYETPFYYEQITSAVINSGVTNIGKSFFDNCTSLTSVTIPNSVTKIGESAFFWCTHLTNIAIPNSVTSIGSYAFYGCTNLTNITIPDSVITIGQNAFENCYFTSDNFVNNSKCQYKRGETIVDTDTDGFCIKDNVLVKMRSNYANGEVSIPNGVIKIGDRAFEECKSLVNVTIPDSVTNIGQSAFVSCYGLTSVTIPNSVTRIAEQTFYHCTNLTNIIIPDSVISIAESAFQYCTSLANITIPNTVKSIGNDAFYSCYFTSDNFVNNSKCQYNRGETIVDTDTDGFCMKGDVLVNMRPSYAIGEVSIPKDVTSIGESAFSRCANLTSIIIPNNVTSIGSFAFMDCTSMTNITIPNSVTTIDQNAFVGCSNLTDITIPNSVTSISYGMFSYCTSLRNVTIPNSVTSIDAEAFMACTSMTNITIPDSVTSIGAETFRYCTSLTNITIPNSVTTIDQNAFVGCSNLTDITIPNSVTSISYGMFSYCTSLRNVTIPNSVTSIDAEAFMACTSMTNITIPDSVTSIGAETFRYCTSLTNITIPSSVTTIDFDAFDMCNSLLSVIVLNANCHFEEPFLKNNVKIYGFENSTVDKYAASNGNYFVKIYCNDYGMKHLYSKKVIKKSTCENEGDIEYTCDRCLYSYDKKVDALGHTYKQSVTPAAIGKDGKIVKKCSVCGATVTSSIAKISSVSLSAVNYTYNGGVKTPSVTVKDSKGKKLSKGKDYTVSYSSGRKNVGRYAVKIKLKGNYSGTVTKTFDIVPKGTSIKKISASKKSFKVYWKAQKKNTTGYEIQYSTAKSFKNAKTVKVSKNSATSQSVAKLSGKKKYFVRVRTNKTVKFDGKKCKVHSSWSTPKTVVTKK